MSPSSHGRPPAGLVLAAGRSARLGEDKLLVRWRGEPLVARAVRAALGAGLDPVVAVLAPGAGAARAALDGLACRVVENPDPAATGPGGSLAAGVAALPGDAPAAVVLLADMPRVSSEMIAGLVERWRGTSAPLVLSDYGGATAPPALYDRRLFPELASARGERAGKDCAARHRAEAQVCRWPAEALFDVDEPGDLAKLE